VSQWPVHRPANWITLVNAAVEEPTLPLLRESANGGKPFDSEQWVAQTARRLGLEYTLRRPGRPKKNAVMENQ
jgi:putative transposase